MSNEGKSYLADVVDENGIMLITVLLSAKNKEYFLKWVKGIGSTIDEQNK